MNDVVKQDRGLRWLLIIASVLIFASMSLAGASLIQASNETTAVAKVAHDNARVNCAIRKNAQGRLATWTFLARYAKNSPQVQTLASELQSQDVGLLSAIAFLDCRSFGGEGPS